MERPKQTERLEVRISPELLKQFDDKIAELKIPSRSAALKILIKDFVAPELRPIQGADL